MDSWIEALSDYSYPVNLSDYERRHQFPGYFDRFVTGNRESTVEFEDYFREKAHESKEVYIEVVYWKLYSWIKVDPDTKNLVDYIAESIKKCAVNNLYNAVQNFVNSPEHIQDLQHIRGILGLKRENGKLAIALTFPAFFDPERYPMIDRKVAQWVNANLKAHNKNRQHRLTAFKLLEKDTSLADVDFNNYLNWVYWCRETAGILNERDRMHWRARDVEMAVFASQRSNSEKNRTATGPKRDYRIDRCLR